MHKNLGKLQFITWAVTCVDSLRLVCFVLEPPRVRECSHQIPSLLLLFSEKLQPLYCFRNKPSGAYACVATLPRDFFSSFASLVVLIQEPKIFDFCNFSHPLQIYRESEGRGVWVCGVVHRTVTGAHSLTQSGNRLRHRSRDRYETGWGA